MKLTISNKTVRQVITIALASWIYLAPNPESLWTVVYRFPLFVWMVTGWITVMWLVSRPMFDFEYEISMSWVSIILALTGLILIAAGFQLDPLSQLMMQTGLYVLGIGVMIGIKTYFETNKWVKVESTMSIIGLLLLLISQLPALASIDAISQIGMVMFVVGSLVMVLTYTKPN